MSPGIARYILTGGSDGTTLAAVLAQLAAKEAIAIEPRSGAYRITMGNPPPNLAPEEAVLMKILARNSSAGSTVIDPRSKPQVENILNAIQESFRNNLQGVYFRWNGWCVGLGMAATFLWGPGTGFGLRAHEAGFLSLWLIFFTSIAGLIFGGVVTSKPSRPTLAQRSSFLVIPLFFFILPGYLFAHFALREVQYFVLAVLLSVMLNSIFMVLMRAPTPAGQKALEHLAGFREFLVRVEQDRLERLNTAEEKAALMNRFLPYAIALGVKEGWGDTMASAFSNAVVER